jgi:RNA polymerase sigma factor (sigma-70 family)
MHAHLQTPSAEALLSHADWVRALARTLVDDPDRADDLAQEAWLDALERPPRDARNLRGWLAQVVRNAARQARRSQTRRDARERDVARPEALPSTAELVAHAELQREVVDHVLALSEPYRTTVLLRYFQGLDAREIAARQAVPLATVRTRLQRALAQLRERMDRARGERASWCAALLPLAYGRGAPGAALRTMTSVSIGGGSVAIAWKAGLAALVLAGAWWAWRSAGEHSASPRAASAPEQFAANIAQAPAPPANEGDARAPIPDERESVPEAPSSASAPPAGPVKRLVEGRVVDELGRPVGGLRLVASVGASQSTASRQHATTADDGSFAFEVEGIDYHVGSADEAWVLTCVGAPLGRSEQIWVAVPAIALAGIVVDEAGVPVEGASVVAGFTCAALKEFPYVLYGAESQSWTTSSAADGAFRFATIPSGSEIVVTAEGYEATRLRELAAVVRIVLSAARALETRAIRGLVVDEEGAPVGGAGVHFAQHATTTDGRGEFELVLATWGDATPLSAAKSGHAATVLERFGQTVRENPEGVDGIVLRLGGAPLSIAGRVLDEEGRPCPGWWIDLADGTPMGTSSLTLEGESAGLPRAAMRLQTDGDGSFRVGGLRERTYRVRAFDSTRCLFLVSEPTPAGSEDLVLRVPGDAMRPLLRGRVLSRGGRPVGGAVVRVTFTQQVLSTGEELVLPCRETQADADGWFEIVDLARPNVLLRVDGPHVRSSEGFPIPPSGDVELRASVQCRFRADVRADDPADRLRVLDVEGRELPVTVQSADVSALHTSVQRRGDGFPVCIVGEEAAILVLQQGDVELRRIPIELSPNELQIVALP